MATRELEVSVDGRRIELRGDVNASAEAALMGAWEQVVAGGEGPVTLDFSDAEYINSTGIALIVGLLAQARTHEIEVRATGLSDHYREIFEITRLADFMTIEGSSDA